MSQYKDTLNLPATSFPMKANLANREPETLAYWEDIGLYHELQHITQNRPHFILHDGPPYANGDIHIGHAVNKILKDIINKSRLMAGYSTPYIPGWDCHGLPIELKVEDKVGKAGRDIDYSSFRAKCREYAQKQINQQRQSFKRIGVCGDWGHPYQTMDPVYEADIVRSVAQIIENDHLEGGYKPVYWCLHCQSALAEAEVEYYQTTSPAIDVKFPLHDKQTVLNAFNSQTELDNISVPIWTTTPWTLPANRAVAVHPQATYCLLQYDQQGLIVAESLVSHLMARYQIEDYVIIGTLSGEDLEHFQLEHPFLDRLVPIVLGAHVTLETGTGAVHTAPAHGQEDFLLGQHYHLTVDNPVNDAGYFHDTVPYVAEQRVFQANDTIVDLLKAQAKLLSFEKIAHSYPCCWRHKKPLIFRATKQWFISMEKNQLRHQALQAIDQIQWEPQWSRERIKEMITNRPDWCISRQRSWGTPLPLLIHKQTGERHPHTVKLMRQVADAMEEGGMEAWYAMPIEDLLPPDEAKNYQKCLDTLDVWLDAGVSHTCVIHARQETSYPSDVYIEGNDQFRGWFQSSLLTSVAMYQQPAFKTVIAHGFTVDPEGRKMSKSLGNVVDPKQVMKTKGADILRLWVAGSDYRGEMSLSEEILKRTSDMYRRLRNTIRFLMANLNDFNPQQHQVAYHSMLALDQWALDRAQLCQQAIQANYENYKFHLVTQRLQHFCAMDMGGFYLDVIKDRQYTTPANSLARRSGQTAMYHIMEALVRWLSPILSFTAEEIWQHLTWHDQRSVFYSTWHTQLPVLSENAKLRRNDWQRLMAIRDEVNKILEQYRSENVIGSPLEAEVTLHCNEDDYQLMERLGDELHYLFITSQAYLKRENNAKAHDTELAGLQVSIEPSSYPKCGRCWHRRSEVGQSADHPQLCQRCIGNIGDNWEVRHYI